MQYFLIKKKNETTLDIAINNASEETIDLILKHINRIKIKTNFVLRYILNNKYQRFINMAVYGILAYLMVFSMVFDESYINICLLMSFFCFGFVYYM